MVANFFLHCLLRSILVNFDCCLNCYHNKIVVILAPLKLIIIHALRNHKRERDGHSLSIPRKAFPRTIVSLCWFFYIKKRHPLTICVNFQMYPTAWVIPKLTKEYYIYLPLFSLILKFSRIFKGQNCLATS